MASMQAYEINPSAADGRLALGQKPVPAPGAGEVLVRLRAASLNYRDILIADNMYGTKVSAVTPLSDGAGEVVAVGDGVAGVAVGARVMGAFLPDWIAGPLTAGNRARQWGNQGPGMLAQYVVLPAHAAIAVPDHLSYEEAATLPCAAVTAWHALTGPARLVAGDTVLLQGTGGVSIMALQFAKMMGLRVIATSSSDGKIGRLREIGADATINYRTEPDWDRRAVALTDGRGVDLVVEIGGAGTLPRALGAVRIGGTVVSIGLVAAGGAIDPMPILRRNISLVGITVGSCGMFAAMCRAIALHAMHPVIDRVFPFAEAAAAYAHLRSGAHFGKVVIAI